MGERLGCGADAIAAVISKESGFDPKARNKNSRATGLIQWIPSTAKSLGTDVDQIFEMSAIEQLALLEKTFAPWKGRLTARDVPLVVFSSAYVGKPDDHVAYRSGQKGYDWNAPLDKSKDGELTVGEIRDWYLAPLVSASQKPRIEVPSSSSGGSVASSASGSSGDGFVGGLVLTVIGLLIFLPRKGH